MFDGIITLVVGIILVAGFLAPFIASLNTEYLSPTDTALLGFVVTIALILIIWGAIKALRSSSFKL